MKLIKIGGGQEIKIEQIIEDIARLEDDVVILHGANSTRDKIASDLGYKKRTITSVSGVSSVYSDDRLLDLMMMSYAGVMNKRIVEKCQQVGINAVGLSGLDGQLITGKRNRGIRATENGKKKIIRDNSGKATKVNTPLIRLLLDANYIPVITVPILDQDMRAINSENDDILALLVEELEPEVIISLIEAPGILRDVSDPSSLIENGGKDVLVSLMETLDGRIQRKIMATLRMIQSTSCKVIIADGRLDNPIQSALEGQGSLFQE